MKNVMREVVEGVAKQKQELYTCAAEVTILRTKFLTSCLEDHRERRKSSIA